MLIPNDLWPGFQVRKFVDEMVAVFEKQVAPLLPNALPNTTFHLSNPPLRSPQCTANQNVSSE